MIFGGDLWTCSTRPRKCFCARSECQSRLTTKRLTHLIPHKKLRALCWVQISSIVCIHISSYLRAYTLHSQNQWYLGPAHSSNCFVTDEMRPVEKCIMCCFLAHNAFVRAFIHSHKYIFRLSRRAALAFVLAVNIHSVYFVRPSVRKMHYSCDLWCRWEMHGARHVSFHFTVSERMFFSEHLFLLPRVWVAFVRFINSVWNFIEIKHMLPSAREASQNYDVCCIHLQVQCKWTSSNGTSGPPSSRVLSCRLVRYVPFCFPMCAFQMCAF